jgi:hypothetical protein
MADEKQQSDAGGLQEHPLIQRLPGGAGLDTGAPSPPPDASVQFGYPARDPAPGFWRVYEDLSFRSYLRVAEADVVATQTLATETEPLRPSVIWVRRGADLEYTRVDTRRVQAGSLEGPFVQGLGSPALAVGAGVTPPVIAPPAGGRRKLWPSVAQSAEWGPV